MSVKKWRRADLATGDVAPEKSGVADPSEWIGSGLGRRGVSEECCASAARMLEPKLRGLSEEVTGWMLDGIALILVSLGPDYSRLTPELRTKPADARVFEGFSLEVQKLDETVKILNAYLKRLKASPTEGKVRQLQ
jgi:hypothetical protein